MRRYSRAIEKNLSQATLRVNASDSVNWRLQSFPINTGRNDTSRPRDDLTCAKRSSDDASDPSGLLPRENERDRNGVTRNSDGYARGGRTRADSSFFLFFVSSSSSSSSSTYAPVTEKMILASERCAFVSARDACRFSASASVLHACLTLNTSVRFRSRICFRVINTEVRVTLRKKKCYVQVNVFNAVSLI